MHMTSELKKRDIYSRNLKVDTFFVYWLKQKVKKKNKTNSL